MSQTVKVQLSKGQVKKLLAAISDGSEKPITLKIPSSKMVGNYPIKVSDTLARRHEINSREGKGMLIKIRPTDLDTMKGEGLADIFTKPLTAVIKTGIEGIKQGLDKERTGRGNATLCPYCKGSGLKKSLPKEKIPEKLLKEEF